VRVLVFFSDDFPGKVFRKRVHVFNIKRNMTTTTLFLAPSSSSYSRAGGFLLLARMMFFVALLVFASATPRSVVSAKVHFSETFDGTQPHEKSKSKRVSILFFFFLLLRLAGERSRFRAFFVHLFISLTFFSLSSSYFH